MIGLIQSLLSWVVYILFSPSYTGYTGFIRNYVVGVIYCFLFAYNFQSRSELRNNRKLGLKGDSH